MTARGRTRLVLVALLLVVLAALADGWHRQRLASWNDAIDRGALPAESAGQPAPLRFAHAAERAASGAVDEALDRYRALQDDSPLGQAARFNSANLLMRQALDVRQTQQPGQAVPLIELAKEGYREVLRRDPSHWAARYNLERAQRALPDPEGEDPPAGPARNAERAATTMRAISPGLP